MTVTGTTYPYCYTDVGLPDESYLAMRVGRDLIITVEPGPWADRPGGEPKTTMVKAWDGDGNDLGVVAEYEPRFRASLGTAILPTAIAAAAHLWPDHYTGDHPNPPTPPEEPPHG